jgi:hypothetical protein
LPPFFFVQSSGVNPEIDDRTVAYVVAAQPVFEDLRQVAAQLAGMLVLSATGAKTAAPDHPMLATAAQVFDRAADAVERARSSVTDRARPHHDDLVRAASSLRDAIAATRLELARAGAAADLEVPLRPLRHAYECLQHAASALPGFQMVAFDQGCCGVHLKVDTTYETR